MLEKAPYNLKSPGHHLRPTHRRVKSYPIRTPKLKRQDGKENLTSPVALYRWPRARGMLGARLGGWKTFSGNHRPNGRGTPRPSTRTKHARGRLHPWPEGCAPASKEPFLHATRYLLQTRKLLREQAHLP